MFKPGGGSSDEWNGIPIGRILGRAYIINDREEKKHSKPVPYVLKEINVQCDLGLLLKVNLSIHVKKSC